MISQIHEVWLKFYTPEGFPVLWLTWIGTLAVCDRYTTTTGMSHREEINSSLMNKNSLERHLSNWDELKCVSVANKEIYEK